MPDEGQGANDNPNDHVSMHIPFPRLKLTSDLKGSWQRFKQLWDSYEILTGMDKKSETDKGRVAMFITAIGDDALEIHNHLPYKSPDEKGNISKILEYWSQHCEGKTNVIYERYQFNNCVQGSDDSFDAFLMKLRALAVTCEFGALSDDFIRDRIVCGVKNNTLRKQMLQKPNLKLDDAVSLCKAAEATLHQSEAMQQPSSSELNAVRESQPKPKFLNMCRFCSQSHENDKYKCPALNRTCKVCGKLNHFANSKVCKGKQKYSSQSKRRHAKKSSKKYSKHAANAVQSSASDSDTDTCSDYEALTVEEEISNVHSCASSPQKQTKIMSDFIIGSNVVKTQVDCGASCNVLPKKNVPKGVKIKPCKTYLSLYDKSCRVKVIGTCRVPIKNKKNGRKYMVKFKVIDQSFTPLIGKRDAERMELITVNYHNIANTVHMDNAFASKELIKQEYHEVFNGHGKMPGKIHLETDDTVAPVVMPPRKVPLAVKPKLKTELERLTELNVIEPVTGPTDWVSALVCVEKPNGKLRVCIDPQPLNVALKRVHYPLPVIEDILPELKDVKVFSKADLKEGFLQCELDEESAKLTTFQTPWGRYCWKRLPFGVSPAPELFQQVLDQNLEGLPGIFIIADDILITGKGATVEEATQDHDANLAKLLARCRDKNITLNYDKFDLRCDEIAFMGHKLTADGLKPDPRKVDAITEMPRPTNVAEVQRFMGMVQYLTKFIPNLSTVSAPIRKLTHKDELFIWTEQQDTAFTKIKELVAVSPVLSYFDPNEPLEAQGDASERGLGFVLLQQGKPVSFKSRALTDAETRYSQIEKELLAQVFGLEKNNQITYGRHVILWTDHKPLVTIAKKPLARAPKRLQNLLLRLLHYDVEIRYMPGKDLILADTLSRAYPSNVEQQDNDKDLDTIHVTSDHLHVTEKTLSELQTATAQDHTLTKVIQYVQHGWPEKYQQCEPDVKPYFLIRDELAYQDNIIVKGQRCVIPQFMRPQIRKKLHAAHTGIQSTLRYARETAYWPNMNAELTDMISKCDTCNSFLHNQPKEPMIKHDIPDRPWEKIGCDILTLDGEDFLVTVDYFSDYFEIDKLQGKKDAAAIIRLLKKYFACHGIPNVMVTDNGPPFNSQTFTNFAAEYAFKHTTSSPTYPQSNGKAENAVKIAKRLLKKTKKAKGDIYLNLLIWRNTPSDGLNSSPAQRMFGRRTKTNMPTVTSLLKPKLIENIKVKKEESKNKQSKYYNRGAKELSELERGDIVRIKPQSGKVWEKAKVIAKVDVRSYTVKTEDGRIYRRNRRHLKKTSESFHDSFMPDIDPTAMPKESIPPPKPNVTPPRRSSRKRKTPKYLEQYECT